jgi:hypothetical protein
VTFPGNFLQIAGETAVSALSNDTRTAEVKDVPGVVKNIFTPRYSSQVDGASTLSLNIIPSSNWSVRLSGRWVGPGFVTLGYTQLPNDVVEGTVAPAVRLFDGKLYARGSLGLQWNNVRNNRISTTRRTIGNLSLNGQFTSDVGMDLQYSNYGMRSAARNDTLRIDNIAQSLTVSPRYSFTSFGGMSTAILSYSRQDYTDYNTVTGGLSNNKSQTGLLVWSLVFPSSLNFATSLMYTISETSILNTKVKSVNETVGHSFFDNKLTTSVTVGYNIVQVTGTDGQFSGRLMASYSMGRGGTFTMMLSSSRYNYADEVITPSYSEYMGSLQYSYSF